MIEYCDGLFVYYDLCGQNQLKEKYGEGVVAVTVEPFFKASVHGSRDEYRLEGSLSD